MSAQERAFSRVVSYGVAIVLLRSNQATKCARWLNEISRPGLAFAALKVQQNRYLLIPKALTWLPLHRHFNGLMSSARALSS